MKWLMFISSLVAAMAMQAQVVDFDNLALHLPTIEEGDTTARHLTFRFTNTSGEPLTIAKVWPTCGCTKVVYQPRGAVADGVRDSIVVRYKSDRSPGTIDESIFVYSDRDDLNPIAKLHVLGEVTESAASQWRHLPKAMGPLRLKRKELTFSENDIVMCIPCANTSPAPLRLKAMLLPPYATFATEPQVIEPQQEADIVVRIDRAKLPETRPVKAALTVEGVPCSIAERKITLTIK